MSDLPPNSAFIAGSKLQFAFDSVSLGELKFCPKRYEFSIIQGWEPRSRNVDLHFGILIHSARERFYHAKAAGAEHDAAVLSAFQWLLEATFDAELGKPWASGDANKNRFTLARTFVWYCEQWRVDPLETIILASGKPAVELSFRFDSGFAFGETPVLLCGHLDRLALFNGTPYISDLKSTKNTLDQSFFTGFSPDNQLSLYATAAPIVWNIATQGIIIDAVQVAVTFSRFQRGIVPRTKETLKEWHDDLGYWLAQAQQYAKDNHWPMNDRNCWRCHFRKICALPPSAREQWLKGEFVQRQWNPLIARGDV